MNYSEKELAEIGIIFSKNVQIHRTVLFFGNNIQIGSNVRVDCYSVITSDRLVTGQQYSHRSRLSYLWSSWGSNGRL